MRKTSGVPLTHITCVRGVPSAWSVVRAAKFGPLRKFLENRPARLVGWSRRHTGSVPDGQRIAENATALADTSEAGLATARLGRVNVRARISGIRVTATVTDPTVTARVQPAIPGLRLYWIARLGTTARPICAPADQPVTDARGRIFATCHGSGASPALRYAIRLTPDVQAGLVLLGTTSRWVVARLAR